MHYCKVRMYIYIHTIVVIYVYIYIYFFFSICKIDASIYSGSNRLVDFGNYVGNLDLPRVSSQHFQSRIVSINSWHVGKARCIRSGVSLPASTESSCCMRCSSCCCSSLQWSKTQRFRDRWRNEWTGVLSLSMGYNWSRLAHIASLLCWSIVEAL